MARPSKLTPDQWNEVGKRLATEGVRALAKEYGINAAAISRRFSQQTQQATRNVAQQIAKSQDALAALPPAQRTIAVNLAEKLRNISSSLASAAELGAQTAHRLNALANSEVAKVDDAEPLESIEALKSIGVLTKLANDSASIACNLLSANKAAVEKANAPDPTQGLDSSARSARVAQLMQLADQRKKATEGQN